MKSISVITLLLTGVFYVFQSCCKAECIDNDIFTLDFQGFKATELEKIKVLRFSNNNFTAALDSYYVSTNNILIKDTTRVYLDQALFNDFDFKIDVEKASRIYTISDFQTRKENCSCGPGTYENIIGYELDWIQYSMQKSSIEIKK